MVKEFVTHTITIVLTAYIVYVAIGWTREARKWEAHLNDFQLRAAQQVRAEAEQMRAEAFAAQAYADAVLSSVIMPIDVVHDGLSEPAAWDENAFTAVEPDKLFGGYKTGCYPMVFALDDIDDVGDPNGVVDPERYPNLHSHMSSDPLLTTEPVVSPRARFEEKTFTVTLPRGLVMAS